MSQIATSLGLLLDIAGALLLYRFGIPNRVDREGRMNLELEQVDEAEIRKAKSYEGWSRLGLALLIFGFAVQLAGNLLK